MDYALFGQAVAEHKLPTDSASVAEAMWPEISELKGTHWHDTLMARRGTVSEASVDSLYKAPTSACSSTSCSAPGPTSDAAQKAAVKQKAEATLARIRKGASFDALAVAALRGSGQQGRQRLPAAESARAVRAGLRQRGAGRSRPAR